MAAFPIREQHKVRLDVFEGPLDLLLYLIKKNEVDIYDIPIEKITSQYVEYLDLMRMLDLNVAGEFIVMAATLMMIKSRMLLPADQRPETEVEEEDPRWELVKQLVEYKRFKEVAAVLEQKEISRANTLALTSPVLASDLPSEPGAMLQDVSIFDMISAVNEVLKRVKTPEPGEIMADRFTVCLLYTSDAADE